MLAQKYNHSLNPKDIMDAINFIDSKNLSDDVGQISFSANDVHNENKNINIDILRELEFSAKMSELMLKTGQIPALTGINDNNLHRAIAASGAGVTKVDTFWWGFHFYMNNNLVNAIVNGLNAAAGVSGIIAIISAICPPPGPVFAIICGIAAGLLTIGATVLQSINLEGKGIVVRAIWPATLTGMWSQ